MTHIAAAPQGQVALRSVAVSNEQGEAPSATSQLTIHISYFHILNVHMHGHKFVIRAGKMQQHCCMNDACMHGMQRDSHLDKDQKS